jgi:hypothetical protein
MMRIKESLPLKNKNQIKPIPLFKPKMTAGLTSDQFTFQVYRQHVVNNWLTNSWIKRANNLVEKLNPKWALQEKILNEKNTKWVMPWGYADRNYPIKTRLFEILAPKTVKELERKYPQPHFKQSPPARIPVIDL